MLWQPRADHEQKHELGDVTITQGLDATRPITEALQLRMAPFCIVSGGGCGLMSSPPQRPGDHEGLTCGRSQEKTREQIADFGGARQEDGPMHQAADAAGLLSFALAQVARRRSAPIGP